jgi:hypothetical protein
MQQEGAGRLEARNERTMKSLRKKAQPERLIQQKLFAFKGV